MALFDEHFLQSPQHGSERFGRQPTESFDEALGVDRPKLIECNEPRLPLKSTWHAPRVSLTSRPFSKKS